MLDPAFVHPLAAVPERRREPEQRVELVLPLPGQGLGREDEHWPVAGQGHELGRHRELERLSQSDLVGEDETRAVWPAVGIEGELHEVLLVLPQPDLLAVHRRFDDRRRWIRIPSPMLDAPYHLAAGQAFEVLDHELRQLHREGR